VLQDPNQPGTAAEMPELEAMARSLGKKIVIAKAVSAREFEAAFAAIAQSGAGALLVSGSPTFTDSRAALVALVARHRLPAIYDLREIAEIGGLISFSGSIADAYRQAGVYTGRILKGAKPAELPVLLPSKFELVVNLKTAKALGIVVPQSILVRADEVIE
jgi:putative ABC transport system substrate-binding protein